jgi:hypothetical protein
MPSNLKYRIKCASVSKLSMFDKENIPEDRYKELVDTGYLTDSDKNIKPSTCAFITKVSADNSSGEMNWIYLCGIKRWTMYYQLVASNTRVQGGTQTGEAEARVSGANALEGYAEDSIIRRDFFVCKYCNSSTAEATKHGIAGEEFVEFPMCNCYTPRGGLAISVFDGAVQGHLATGYVPDPNDPDKTKEFQNVYNVWNTYKDPAAGTPPAYAGGIPKYVPDNLSDKLAFDPKLTINQMMINARALVATCCWWVGTEPYIYKPSDFKVVDLAVAMETIKKKFPGAIPNIDNMPAITQDGRSDRANYTYEVGDYFYKGMAIEKVDGTEKVLTYEDAYTLNAMFGRNYDWTLPECGNNKRVIYILKATHVLPTFGVLPEDKENGCQPVWFNWKAWSPLSPRNCSYPGCEAKYTWGHVCNGGGAFSLVDGRACPYYQNPLMGDKDTEKRYSKLQNMYPGDSVTAASMLEIMWMSKGGLPWTEEEWKSTWLNPYIWTTVPFNPVFKQTKYFTDENGTQVEGFWHHEYEVYSRKTVIDPKTGKIELKPMRKLPGGSVTAFKRKQDRTMEDGVQVPDIPSLIRKIELRPTGQIKIIWPCPDLADLNLAVTDTQKYQEKLINLKKKVYTKLIWNRAGLVTNVVGQAMRGQYQTGVYCINTAFLQGKSEKFDWTRYREELEALLINQEIAGTRAQEILHNLWRDVNKAQIAGNDPVLKNFTVLKTYLDYRGMFIFPSVPLSLLDDPNHIIVFGFSSAANIDADIVKVKPVFRHAWMYQKNTKLTTSWKAIWNGRPSVFLNERYLYDTISKPVDKGALEKGGTVIQLGGWYYSTATGDFVSEISALQDSIYGLEREIETLNTQLRRDNPRPSTEDITEMQKTLAQKQTQLSALREQLIKASESAYAESIKRMSTDSDKEELVKELDKKITIAKEEKSALENRRDRYVSLGETERAAALTTQIEDADKKIKSLEKKKSEALGEDIPDPPDVSNDQKISTTKYSYKDKKKYSKKGDTDTDEGGVVKEETAITTTTPLAKEDAVNRLYIPFLNSDRTEFRDIGKYNTIDRSNKNEDITLSIPNDSGVIKWDYLSVGQGESADIIPWKTFAPKALKKVVVYSTRESDKGGASTTDPTKPRGAKISKDSKLIKWYKSSACASTIIVVVDPKICNANTEFMIFSMEAMLQQQYKDADGNWQVKDKKIKFMPMNYSQITRPFPGYSTGKTAKYIGTTQEDGIEYNKVEVSEFVEVFDKEVTGRHPWVFFASPVEEKVNVKEWRFYNNEWYPQITAAIPITIPDKTEMDLYMEYAYIGEMYDENEAEAYDWEKSYSSDKQTRILISSPKAGIMRTVFKYTPSSDQTIDGFGYAPIGAHTVATIWPYARYACRDYEISYVWRDNYKGEELSTGNMKNRTMTNYAAGYAYNKTKGKDRQFTMADQGDHDLGTEFQPKLSYSTTTSRNVQGGTPRFHITRAEWSTNFEDKTAQYITNKNPTYGFPTDVDTIFSPPDNVGSLYYPYTRGETGTAYVPRHKTYTWDFLDRWRNKADEAKDLGGFRLQAYDWCVKGTDVVRIRQWSRHWFYDTKRETKFLGRSKTRGPVFQLEYREYFDLPTKTVFLKPYAATTSYAEDQCYCPECNRYFKRDKCASGGACPLCGIDKGTITKKSAWSADWTYLVDRVDSEPVTLQTGEEQLTEEELKAFVPDDPSTEKYEEWKERVTKLYTFWTNAKTESSLESLKREQARGKIKGWIVDYTAGLKFVNDEESQATSAEAQRVKELSQKSQVNMLTGCDKYGDKKRLDLGAFQLSDEYVPGSVTPYYGSDPASRGEFEYQELEARARAAEREAEKQDAEYKKLQRFQNIIRESPNATVTYSDGTQYGSAQRAQQSGGSTPGDVANIDEAYNNAIVDEETKKTEYDEAYADLKKYEDVLESLKAIQKAVQADATVTKPFTDGKIYANIGSISSIDVRVSQALADKDAAEAAAAGTVPPFSDPALNAAFDSATNTYNGYKSFQDSMALNPERVYRGFDDDKIYGKVDQLTDPSGAITEQEQKVTDQQTTVNNKKQAYEDAKAKRESLKRTKDSLYGQPNSTAVDPVTGETYGNKTEVQSIDDKVQEQEQKKAEAESKASEARSKVEQLNAKTARGQARNELNKKTEKAREKLEKQCMRYYEYQQTAFGYNYPWSPYDSPPLFGNMGRELFVVEICTIGGAISWLPREKPSVISTFPTIPSWWTSRDPDGTAREMVVMLSPPHECTRALVPLSSEPYNPFYNYLFTDAPFSEQAPSIQDPGVGERNIFSNPSTVKELRIVTEHNTRKYGQPSIRSDVGRFTLTVSDDSSMSAIYVTCDSPAVIDSQDLSQAGLTMKDPVESQRKQPDEDYPEPYIDGLTIKGFSVLAGDYMYVGQRYPGFTSPYEHGKFFVGYKTVQGFTPSWAWPSDVRDTLIRAKKTVRWYLDLLPPDTSSGTQVQEVKPKYLTDAVNDQGLWAIPTLQCAPYFQKTEDMDDGRDISGGPELDEDKTSSSKNEKEKTYKDTSFAIIVESERVDEDGTIRPPLMWIEKLDNADIQDIGAFKVPTKPDIMVHRVATTGSLVPVTLAKGDEDSKDEKGFPNYKTAFSTGKITDTLIQQWAPNANLITKSLQNESGLYPGFSTGIINHRTVGKVYLEKEIPVEWYKKIRLLKQKSIAGTNQHKVTGTFVLKNFFANLLFVEVTYDDWFKEQNVNDYFLNISDSLSVEVKVYGSPIPGGDTFPSKVPTFINAFPLKKSPTVDELTLTYNCDFGVTANMIVEFTWWIRTDPNNFNLGPWKAMPETKRTYAEQTGWTETPDESKYSYLNELVKTIKFGSLMPGKCAEVVTVKETKFGVSRGPDSDVKRLYNFFTESDSKLYKPNWEDFDKRTERKEGWWKQSGRLTTEDAGKAGVSEQWMVKAEEEMWKKLREAEEDTSTGGLYDAQGKKKSSALGKEPAAQIFPRVCAELPELPTSRLKINAWNALNWDSLPDTRDPYEWPQRDGDQGWAWGGIWTTRMAGPEWVTADQYPTRDMIWWPALPYEEGHIVMKGRYFKFGPQYKDESKVINEGKARGVDKDDKINEFAYKYEVRGFDTLLRTIQTVEQTTAEDRRSATNAREYGVNYAQNYNASNKGISVPGNDYASQMAQSAVDGILNSNATAKNYRVNDQRTWVFLDEINMKIDEVNWTQIKEREENQKKVWDEAKKLDDGLTSIKFTAIIPYHEWNEILDMTGYYLQLENKFVSRGLKPITARDLEGKKESGCSMEWKEWSWEEISSFSFRSEEKNKYPLNSSSGSDWKTILVRRCGSKWAHKDAEVDGGKIWSKWGEEWAKAMKRGRAAVKRGFPTIVSIDCKRKSDSPEGQNLEHFDDSGGTECKDLKQKWKPEDVLSWPRAVSSDGGSTLNRPDPWWRF